MEESSPPAPELTDKQRRFVEEYCIDFNAAGAARRAGYSEGTAYSIGWENLRKPDISKAISAKMAELTMTSEEAAVKLTNWGRGTVEPFLTEDGYLNLKSDQARKNLHLIKKVKVVRRVEHSQDEDTPDADIITTEIELHDAKDATVKVLEYHGKLVQKHEHKFNSLDKLTPDQLEQLRVMQEAIQNRE